MVRSYLRWWLNAERRAVKRELRHLATERAPLVVEVERRSVRYPSVLALRSRDVVLLRPYPFRKLIETGGMLRVTSRENREVVFRMEVTEPLLQMNNGRTICLCRYPEEFAEPDKRTYERYTTVHARSLNIELEETGSLYRVLDLSRSGCKIKRNLEDDPLDVGDSVRNARIVMGQFQVRLDELTTRAAINSSLGCEFRVASGRSEVLFDRFMRALQKKTARQLRTPMAI